MDGEREAMTVVIQRLRDAASSLLQGAEDLERMTAVKGTEATDAEQEIIADVGSEDEREVNAAKHDDAGNDNGAMDERQSNGGQTAYRSMQSAEEQGRDSSPGLPTLAEILGQSQKRKVLGLRANHHELQAAKATEIDKDVVEVNATKRRAVEDIGPAQGTKRKTSRGIGEVDRTKSTDVIDLTNKDVF